MEKPHKATIAVAVVPPPSSTARTQARKVRASHAATIAAPAVAAPVRSSASHAATIAVPVVPPANGAGRVRKRPSENPTLAVAAVPQASATPTLMVLPTAPTMLATGPRHATQIAADVPRDPGDSSIDITFEDATEDLPPIRHTLRPITIGEGVLQRVPQPRRWLVPTIVAGCVAVAAAIVGVAIG